MGLRTPVLVALLLFTPSLALLPVADACATTSLAIGGVPCGRIYPLILLKIDGQEPQYPMVQGVEMSWDAVLTYKFSINDNGYTVATDDVVVTFEYPRKPDWVDLSVEPDRLVIPVNDPRYLKPNADDPNNVQAEYEYTTPVTIKARLNGGQPVLRDGYEYAKLLVFAKSTESGLYQAGYGIKEIRVAPEGALHESDVAGSRDVFTATPVSTVTVTGGSASFAGTTVTLAPPAQTPLWQPSAFEVKVDPAPTGRMVVAITEESGALVAMHGPVAASGAATFNVTLAHPGRHLATVTLLPGGATANGALPMTFHVPFDVGDLAPEGFAYPKAYLLTETHTVPMPNAGAEDPVAQWERDIPFFAYDTAQSTVASVMLATPGLDALGRSATNLQFAIIDPEGKQLNANSVDPTNPVRSIRIGSLPGDGWYTLRITGAGAPTVAAYVARVEVAYALPPEHRDRADGALDATGGVLPVGGRNLTLPVEDLAVWGPNAFTPALEGFEGAASYALTVTDAEGRLAYASGLRTGEASFAPPAPGTYHASVYAEPQAGTVFPPTLRVFTFTVGEGRETVAQSFRLEDVVGIPTALSMTPVAAYGLVLPEGVTWTDEPPALGEGLHAEFLDATGAPVDAPSAPGAYTLLVHATNAGPAKTAPVAYGLQLSEAVTLRGPASGDAVEPAQATIPGFAVALAIGVVGAVAVAAAFFRRP